MPDSIIEGILNGSLSADLLIKWLHSDSSEEFAEEYDVFTCTKGAFVAYFLAFLRCQMESILQTNSTAQQLLQNQNTPDKVFSKLKDSEKDVEAATSKKRQESPNRSLCGKKPGRRIKTKLFNDCEKSPCPRQNRSGSDDSSLTSGMERLVVCSTPVKNASQPDLSFNVTSPVTPEHRSYERCDTPRNSRFKQHSSEMTLADYFINVQSKQNKKKKSIKNTSVETTETTKAYDLSTDFPEIGTKKTEKRRIKPTSLDNSSDFVRSSVLDIEENAAFKSDNFKPKEMAKDFETERAMLKQERDNLIEKFNSTPSNAHIKIVKRPEPLAKKTVESDVNKVVFKEKLDILSDVYDLLLKNHMILSINSELYFLISLLLSKQLEEDYDLIESQITALNSPEHSNCQIVVSDVILKTVHNATYFAVKSLWKQRNILEIVFEKNSLKILGENKKIRNFLPDLAKFLLNSYSLKCEAEIANPDEKSSVISSHFSNSNICFNSETDNSDNFPTMLSFQQFKKQRDMFCEILRWSESQQYSKSSLKARIKVLLQLSVTSSNYSHLARLFVSHMMSECVGTGQVSKMDMLQRRLTSVSAPAESNRLPKFTAKERFFRDFLVVGEQEALRVHVRAWLAAEVAFLEGSALRGCEDRAAAATTTNTTGTDIEACKEYLLVLKKLRVLSKFLGFLTSLPFSSLGLEYPTKHPLTQQRITPAHAPPYAAPSQKLLDNEIAVRDALLPPIDILEFLDNSMRSNRLCITIPWVVQFLSMLDYTSLRLKYYKKLISRLFEIYSKTLKTNRCMKPKTVVFLKLCLGWLFELPHFPQDFFYNSEFLSNTKETYQNLHISQIQSQNQESNAKSIESLKEFRESNAPHCLVNKSDGDDHMNNILSPSNGALSKDLHKKDLNYIDTYNQTEKTENFIQLKGKCETDLMKEKEMSEHLKSIISNNIIYSNNEDLRNDIHNKISNKIKTDNDAMLNPKCRKDIKTEYNIKKNELNTKFKTNNIYYGDVNIKLGHNIRRGSSSEMTEFNQIKENRNENNRIKPRTKSSSSANDAKNKSDTESSVKNITKQRSASVSSETSDSKRRKESVSSESDIKSKKDALTSDGDVKNRNDSIDYLNIVDESIMSEGCQFLKDVNSLLVSNSGKELKDGSIRHVTLVTMSLKPSDRIKNKERELQAKLEEQLIRNQAVSTRRVLELAVERVAAAAVRHLAAELPGARARAARAAARLLSELRLQARAAGTALDMKEAREKVGASYSAAARALVEGGRASGAAIVAARLPPALDALLGGAGGGAGGSGPGAARHLTQLATRAAINKINNWIADNWTGTEMLCKDIGAEVRNLMVLGSCGSGSSSSSSGGGGGGSCSSAARTAELQQALVLPAEQFEAAHPSPSALLIDMKECVCSLLEGGAGGAGAEAVAALCARGAACSSPRNVLADAPARRALMQLSLDLAILIISKKPAWLTPKLLNQLYQCWDQLCPERRRNVQPDAPLPEGERRRSMSPPERDFTEEKMPTPVSSEDEDEDDKRPLKVVIPADVYPSAQAAKCVLRLPAHAELKCGSSEQSPPPLRDDSPRYKPQSFTYDKSMSWASSDLPSPLQKSLDSPQLVASSSSPCPGPELPELPPQRRGSRLAPHAPRSPRTPSSPKADESHLESGENLSELFERVLCPRNIVLCGRGAGGAGEAGDAVWTALADLLLFLLRRDLLSEQSLTEQCVAIYKQDWSRSVLEGVSRCLRAVTAARGGAPSPGAAAPPSRGRLHHLLDFLAHYCNDLHELT